MSPYITPQGHQQLKNEFEQLWRTRRPEVVRALAAAAAEGDRSENAEYIYRKKELREIDRRLKYLTTRLQEVKVVERPPTDREAVFFGAHVTLADETGEERSYRLVGADEVSHDHISIDSPLARALLKKRVGDTVRVLLPKGEVEFEVLAVGY